MAKQMRTRSVTAAQARSYLSKTEEYLAASEDEWEAERCIAATSSALHAAINAADAVCGFVSVIGQLAQTMIRSWRCSGRPARMEARAPRTSEECSR